MDRRRRDWLKQPPGAARRPDRQTPRFESGDGHQAAQAATNHHQEGHTMSTTTVEKLQEQRSAAVAIIERITVAALLRDPVLSPEEWQHVSADCESHRRERDALEQQIRWENRHLYLGAPLMPAWTD